MTRLEKHLAEMLLREVRGLTARQSLQRLLECGLIDWKACERRAIRQEVFLLQQQGMPRCEAFEVVAARFCCSYEKVRNAFYNPSKN